MAFLKNKTVKGITWNYWMIDSVSIIKHDGAYFTIGLYQNQGAAENLGNCLMKLNAKMPYNSLNVTGNVLLQIYQFLPSYDFALPNQSPDLFFSDAQSDV